MVKDLTKTEKKVLDLFLGKNMSVSEMAIEREVSKRAIYKHMNNLKRKGWISDYQKKGSKKGKPPIMPPKNQVLGKRYYRIHNLHFILTPYYKYKTYKEYIGDSFFLGKWYISVNTDNIEVQSKSKSSFDDNKLEDAVNLMRNNLIKTIYKIQNRVHCEILKNDKLNIRLVNHHIAEVNNGVAQIVDSKKIQIQDEYGKIWLVIDKSMKVPELETVDPVKALDDSRVMKRYFNDMRTNKPPTNSELASYLKESMQMQKVYNENIKKHLQVLEEMRETLRAIRDKL